MESGEVPGSPEEIFWKYVGGTGSTQRLAWCLLEVFRSYPRYLCLWTDWQVAGYGRRGRPWWCQAKGSCLALSVAGTFFLLERKEPEFPQQLVDWLGSGIPAVVVSTLRHMFTHSALFWHVKLPNDLFLHGKKVGGILTEVRWHKSTRASQRAFSVSGERCSIVVGIGLNLRASAFPEHFQRFATALAMHGVEVSPNALVHRIGHALLRFFRQMEKRFSLTLAPPEHLQGDEVGRRKCR